MLRHLLPRLLASFHKLDNSKWKLHTGSRARKQKYISTYISLYMKTFLKTGVKCIKHPCTQLKSGSPFRWPTKQACIKHPCTQDLSSSPTGLYIYIYIYIYILWPISVKRWNRCGSAPGLYRWQKRRSFTDDDRKTFSNKKNAFKNAKGMR